LGEPGVLVEKDDAMKQEAAVEVWRVAVDILYKLRETGFFTAHEWETIKALVRIVEDRVK
jgi:hypothetical protein